MPRFWIIVGGGALLAIVLALAFLWAERPDYPQARPGETLIAIGQFANYTGGAQGYNVTGRVREALERELTADRLSAVRAASWPDVIPDAPTAQAVAKRSGAELVIWGEYDSGRVVARLTAAKPGAEPGELRVEKLAASPGDLPTAINGDLPEEIRYLALLTLGQLYVDRGDLTRGRAILEQAAARPPTDATALASLYFLLGYANQQGEPADLDAAIDYYGQVLALRPDNLAAHNNRGLAYLRRGGPGDAASAVTDLTEVIAVLPEDGTAYNNRAAAYLQLGGAENLTRAVADLDRAITLAPDSPEATFNRGLAHVRQAEPPGLAGGLRPRAGAGARPSRPAGGAVLGATPWMEKRRRLCRIATRRSRSSPAVPDAIAEASPTPSWAASPRPSPTSKRILHRCASRIRRGTIASWRGIRPGSLHFAPARIHLTGRPLINCAVNLDFRHVLSVPPPCGIR